jgi:hypothetical protein
LPEEGNYAAVSFGDGDRFMNDYMKSAFLARMEFGLLPARIGG